MLDWGSACTGVWPTIQARYLERYHKSESGKRQVSWAVSRCLSSTIYMGILVDLARGLEAELEALALLPEGGIIIGSIE